MNPFTARISIYNLIPPEKHILSQNLLKKIENCDPLLIMQLLRIAYVYALICSDLQIPLVIDYL